MITGEYWLLVGSYRKLGCGALTGLNLIFRFQGSCGKIDGPACLVLACENFIASIGELLPGLGWIKATPPYTQV